VGKILDDAGFQVEPENGGHLNIGISSLLGIKKFTENSV
jgi:hypothetical protein